jgi:hypothetical protein
MNYKAAEGAIVVQLEALSGNLSEGTEKNNEKYYDTAD